MTSDLGVRRRGRRESVAASSMSTAAGRATERRSSPDDDLPIEVEPHRCFACGVLNEHGLHLDLHVGNDRAWCEVAVPARFQGWDGIAHGGIVCTILDEVMAWALAATDNWGVTARMSVTFRKPVAIGTKVRGDGWITESRRRVIGTAARIVDERTGTVLAEATATYVAADEERKRQLRARYRFRIGDGTSPDAAR